ncbi:MAG: hypothetical protein K2P81_00375 [Bacteriovoracaceae bacterium]|nr:hypothetical protein [Bacteriovoracaceae bacterium]
MGMLERIKKRQWDGLKDFVESLEVTGASQRQMIMLNGILEDPLFMRWVTKNLKTFNDFLQLSGDEIDAVVRANDAMLGVIAKALPIENTDELQKYSTCFPRVFGKLKDEVSYLSSVSQGEKESAQYFVMRAVRKLQKEEAIQGFHWQLPPQEIFFEKPAVKEGKITLTFEDGTIAAEGEVLKSKRIGLWRHYYDNGRLLAEGNYQEGVKTGPWTFNYGNGDNRAQGKYTADMRNGIWKEWDRQGQMKETEWKEGKKV